MMDALEQEVIAMVREHKLKIKIFAPSILGMLSKIADRLGWQNLKKEI